MPGDTFEIEFRQIVFNAGIGGGNQHANLSAMGDLPVVQLIKHGFLPFNKNALQYLAARFACG
jgi:hypothetical protein